MIAAILTIATITFAAAVIVERVITLVLRDIAETREMRAASQARSEHSAQLIASSRKTWASVDAMIARRERELADRN